MPHIFISYAKKDTQDLAFNLCDIFNQMPNMSAWVDRSLTAGRSWEGDIQREIRNCDYFVILYSPDINRHLYDSNASESYVLEEIAYAKYTLNKPIIPVMAQATEPPMGMTRIQYINFAAGGISLNQLAIKILGEAGINIATPTTTKKISSKALLPAPFAWIEIPNKGYSMAKYPVTNAQFAKFIEAGGYQNQDWWTNTGWEHRLKDKWIEPRYWKDAMWNGAEQPVVGVNWYESVAFCLWLSDEIGEKIMLPSEEQWQYAAQGDDGRVYPWGNNWDCNRCNNSVKPCDSNVTTPVRQYEGKGDSPFGLVDMAGNVWEWCLTDYNNKTNDFISDTMLRVLRGGSWLDHHTDWFRCGDRIKNLPRNRGYVNGFRLSLSF